MNHYDERGPYQNYTALADPERGQFIFRADRSADTIARHQPLEEGIVADETDEDDDWETDETSPWDEDAEDTTFPCPYCGASIYEDAECCPHCNQYLSAEDAVTNRKPLWVLAVAFALVIAVVWLSFRG